MVDLPIWWRLVVPGLRRTSAWHPLHQDAGTGENSDLGVV